MVAMIRRNLAALALVAWVAAGCGISDGDTGGTIPPATPVPTIAGVGAVPAVPSAAREPIVVVRPPVNDDGTQAQLIGEAADGNRVLLIGDSILASTSSRYGNQMCDTLVPLGWQVEVEAEPSRFIEFGNKVLDKVLVDNAEPKDDWNAAVVFLGSNYRGNELQYEAELTEILDRLSPRPILLFTVTEYRPNWSEVNEVVSRLGAKYDNVTVLDWKTISETPGILSGDRLHPTNDGRRVLAESVAAALGQISVGSGECLRSAFRDDSAVGGNSSTVLGRPSTGSSSSSSSGSSSGATTTTTVKPSTVTTTTVATGGGAATTTTIGSGGDTTTTVPTPAVPTTASPTTAPTTTQPNVPAAPAPPVPPPAGP